MNIIRRDACYNLHQAKNDPWLIYFSNGNFNLAGKFSKIHVTSQAFGNTFFLFFFSLCGYMPV